MHKKTLYSRRIKRLLDIVLSSLAIVGLSPVILLLSLWIILDSPGPVFFKQKRVGKGKELFEILKFRTMRTEAPHDVPTHMLNNPEIYITKSGKLLRKTSLDELPQIFNIFRGQMSIIGPRPALWNQSDLIAERDKYGVNDVKASERANRHGAWMRVEGRIDLVLFFWFVELDCNDKEGRCGGLPCFLLLGFCV